MGFSGEEATAKLWDLRMLYVLVWVYRVLPQSQHKLDRPKSDAAMEPDTRLEIGHRDTSVQ